MAPTVYILILIILFLIAGVIPSAGGTQTAIFRSPVFIAMCALLCLLIVRCCIKRRFSPKQTGFHLAHMGVAIVLCGAFIGFVAGTQSELAVPLMPNHRISSLPLRDGRAVKLDFALSASDFKVDFYEPHSPHESRAPRHYSADLIFTGPDGATDRKVLAVNHPATYLGWRFYLMSYDQESLRYVVLSARKDPGRPAVIAGIWMIIAGIALLCWKRQSLETPL